MWDSFLLSQFHARPRVQPNKCWHSWLSLISKKQAVWNSGALKQGHRRCQACSCQSWMQVHFQSSPEWDILAKSAGSKFSWKVLSICSLIITACTSHNNSSILNFGTFLEFTDAFCVLSHPTLEQACLFLTQEEMEAQEKNIYISNQNHQAAKSQSLDLNPGYPSLSHLFPLFKSCLRSPNTGTHNCAHYTCRW